jgi:type II secretion system protein H
MICHSERSEESTATDEMRRSHAWILRCAQNDTVRKPEVALPTKLGRPPARALRSSAVRSEAGFTLIELIVVMLLLAIAALFVAPSMSSFIRGRSLNFEARRMLSLTHYAQSRAVSEGLPVLLWFNPANSTYGVELQGGYAAGDDRPQQFTADPGVAFSINANETLPVSELEDEKLGLPEGLAVIRFNPDGFFDEVSVRRVLLQQGAEHALELVQKENLLGYEIRPAVLPR